MGYTRGSLIRSTATFENASDVATDPTVVTVVYRPSDGTEVTKIYGTDGEVVKSATGVFYIDLAANSSGSWRVRWTGTGTVVAAVETSFVVDNSEFA